ncbi:MAG: D-alanyl-D-alanine carboxypeptidase family protein [Ruminococcus sp.]|nr:D-alanyl-D-alanine carboxypeptidase family protein [Ruminococcus sp.]
MANRRIRKRRVVLAMIAIVGTLTAADGLRREFFGYNKKNIVVSGDFREMTISQQDTDDVLVLSGPATASTEFEGVKYLGFSEVKVSSSQLSSGALTLVNEQHPAGAVDTSGMVDLFDYKNDYYTLIEDNVMLNEDAAEALNLMMEDYNEATGLMDFIAYGTTDTYTGAGSYCPIAFPESATGYTVDLALNGCGSVIAYDGYDEESWIVENCSRYGFVVRCPEGKQDKTSHAFCPWHLRYVGAAHAAIMTANDLCLEEYIDFVRAYSYDAPYTYTAGGATYCVYYTASEGDITSVRVPTTGTYSISGNNIDGYIVATEKY